VVALAVGVAADAPDGAHLGKIGLRGMLKEVVELCRIAEFLLGKLPIGTLGY
jgi:hypothetical protein